MSETIRVLLADDHAVLRTGLRALLGLEPDMEVVGEAATGEEALERIPECRPHVVVMDLAMPGMGGLEAPRRIGASGEGARVVVLTAHGEEEHLLPILEAGGSGYVQKARADEDLVPAIRAAARDEVFLQPHLVRLVLHAYRSPPPRQLAALSEREREVFALSAEGYTLGAIGRRLDLSPKTVETYRGRVMQKLGINGRPELVRVALETGVLRPQPCPQPGGAPAIPDAAAAPR